MITSRKILLKLVRRTGKTSRSWENYLFRSYIPAVESPIRFQEHISMQEYVKQCYHDQWGVRRFLGSLNEEDERLKDFIAFVKQVQVVTACASAFPVIELYICITDG